MIFLLVESPTVVRHQRALTLSVLHASSFVRGGASDDGRGIQLDWDFHFGRSDQRSYTPPLPQRPRGRAVENEEYPAVGGYMSLGIRQLPQPFEVARVDRGGSLDRDASRSSRFVFDDDVDRVLVESSTRFMSLRWIIIYK